MGRVKKQPGVEPGGEWEPLPQVTDPTLLAQLPAAEPILDLRAFELNDEYFGGRLRWNTVALVRHFKRKFASCTPALGLIQVAERALDLPAWVVDYLLVHELAHLVHPHHRQPFWDLVRRYPLVDRARGFLYHEDLKLRGLPTHLEGAALFYLAARRVVRLDEWTHGYILAFEEFLQATDPQVLEGIEGSDLAALPDLVPDPTGEPVAGLPQPGEVDTDDVEEVGENQKGRQDSVEPSTIRRASRRR